MTICLCPATSEYDPPCPRHGVLPIGVRGVDAAQPVAPPNEVKSVDDIPDGRPRAGTQSRAFWEYGQAFSRGMTNATGTPFTAPVVRGPQDLLVQLLRAHCRDESGALLKGTAVLEWIEATVQTWRQGADEAAQVYKGGWTVKGFARWLDDDRPLKASASSSVAHIQISRAR